MLFMGLDTLPDLESPPGLQDQDGAAAMAVEEAVTVKGAVADEGDKVSDLDTLLLCCTSY